MTEGVAAGPKAPVRLLVGQPAPYLRPGERLGEAAQAMRGADVSAALVGCGDAIVTEGDLTRALAAGLGPRPGCPPPRTTPQEVLLALLEEVDPVGLCAIFQHTITGHAEIWLG
jgi:hypothetical protein